MIELGIVRHGAWVAVACLCFGAWALIRIVPAGNDLDRARSAYQQVERDVARLETMRAQTHVPSVGRRPDADLIARAQRALVAAGLPVSACSGVQPRGDQSVVGSPVRLQTIQVRLQGLKPQELGSWFSAWRQADQPWQVTEVQMVHAQATGTPSSSNAGALDTNRYDSTVALSAPYLEDSP